MLMKVKEYRYGNKTESGYRCPDDGLYLNLHYCQSSNKAVRCQRTHVRFWHTVFRADKFELLMSGERCDVFKNGKYLLQCRDGAFLVRSLDNNWLEITYGLKKSVITDGNRVFYLKTPRSCISHKGYLIKIKSWINIHDKNIIYSDGIYRFWSWRRRFDHNYKNHFALFSYLIYGIRKWAGDLYLPKPIIGEIIEWVFVFNNKIGKNDFNM